MPKIKIVSIFVGLAIIAAVIGDVIEVKINPENFSSIPDKASSLFKDKSALEKGRTYAVRLKRKGEQFVIQDKEKRLEISLLYVSNDATRLRELLNDPKSKPETFLPQAELLIDSLEQVRTRAEEAPVEVVASLKQKSEESFKLAQQTLGQLQELHKEYDNVQREFVRLTESLEKQIGDLKLEEEESVAGTKDESEPEVSKIPLKF
ncbi:MAG: hypothetical protein ABIH36_00300 [bacterium]